MAKGSAMAARIERGRYRVRISRATSDMAAAQRLRHLCFIDGPGRAPRPEGRDADAFDPHCDHLLVEAVADDRLVACCRLLPLTSGAAIGQSYAAQHYGLAALARFSGPMVEMGRFCIHPAVHDPDVLRLAWAAVTRYVDAAGVQMLFGCSSFPGTAAEAHRDAFALLRDRHLAPGCWLPQVKALQVVRFDAAGGDRAAGWLRLPPLLRSYLLMGGWVSDHAVIDDDLGTLHVFTGVEIGKVPLARARALRAIAS